MKKQSVCKLLAAMLVLAMLAGGCSSRDAEQQPELSESQPEEVSALPSQPEDPEPEEEEGEEEEESGEEHDEPSEPEDTAQPQLPVADPVKVENLTVETTLSSYKLGVDTISIDFTNETQAELLTDEWYSIEQHTDYGWQPLELPVSFASGPIWLEDGTTETIEIALYPGTIDYTPGRYRVIKEVLPAAATGEEQQRLQVSAEFVLE